VIESLSGQYNIISLCGELVISRRGYYRWRRRKGRLNRYQINRKDLCEAIRKIHDSYRSYGYRRIAQVIRNQTGWVFSDWLCHQCCVGMKIRSLARRRYKRAGERHEIYPNLLEDDFSVTTPFEKVCTDTTIIKHRGLSYDWTIYLDLFNKKIIAYDLRLSQSGHGIKNHMGALTRFLEAKQQRGYKEMTTMLHSDQGSIYTSRVFNARLDHTIRRSMSRVATPRDNPVLEAMNGWFKDGLRFDFQLRDAQDIHKAIHEYIKYYNQVRLAYALNYKSPVHYRTGLI